MIIVNKVIDIIKSRLEPDGFNVYSMVGHGGLSSSVYIENENGYSVSYSEDEILIFGCHKIIENALEHKPIKTIQHKEYWKLDRLETLIIVSNILIILLLLIGGIR